MARKISRRIKTLRGFVAWAEQFTDGKYLFRGVSKQSYKLEASAYRRLPEGDKQKPHELRKVNRELLERARLLGHALRDGQQRSDLELLAELQHFGAATCLIDFTRNAFIALWFACQQSASGDAANGKVFAVRVDDIARFRTVTSEQLSSGKIDDFFEVDDKGRYPLYQWEPKRQHNRIIAQQSVFILGGAQIQAASECVILKSGKRSILASLEKILGITEASIYPDFDGFARLNAHNRRHIQPDPGAYLQRAIEAHQEGRWDDAIVYYNEVIRLEPDDLTLAEAYSGRGMTYSSKNEVDRAIQDYNTAIELNPDETGAYVHRGIAYWLKGSVDLAIPDYNAAISRDADAYEAYYYLGCATLGEDEVNNAISNFSKAIELKPEFADAYKERGIAYFRNGEVDLALRDYTSAIKLDADDATVYCNRGFAHLTKGAWDEAGADLTLAKDKGVDIVAAFHNVYESVTNFEQKTGVQLPEAIAEQLTQL